MVRRAAAKALSVSLLLKKLRISLAIKPELAINDFFFSEIGKCL